MAFIPYPFGSVQLFFRVHSVHLFVRSICMFFSLFEGIVIFICRFIFDNSCDSSLGVARALHFVSLFDDAVLVHSNWKKHIIITVRRNTNFGDGIACTNNVFYLLFGLWKVLSHIFSVLIFPNSNQFEIHALHTSKRFTPRKHIISRRFDMSIFIYKSFDKSTHTHEPNNVEKLKSNARITVYNLGFDWLNYPMLSLKLWENVRFVPIYIFLVSSIPMVFVYLLFRLLWHFFALISKLTKTVSVCVKQMLTNTHQRQPNMIFVFETSATAENIGMFSHHIIEEKHSFGSIWRSQI